MELEEVNKALTCVIREVAKDQMITRLKAKIEKLEEKIDYMFKWGIAFNTCESCEKLLHEDDDERMICYDCDETYCYNCMESKEFELKHLLICRKCKKNECRHSSICPKCNKKTFNSKKNSCHICYPRPMSQTYTTTVHNQYNNKLLNRGL